MEGPRHISFVIRHLNHIMDRSFCTMKNETENATAYHGRIIGYLFEKRNTDVYQKDIENRFGIRRSTVTKVLQLMESNGLVTRTSVLSDGRLKKITLTEKAVSMHERFRDDIERFEETLSEGITPEELDIFFSVTEKVYNNLLKQEQRKE